MLNLQGVVMERRRFEFRTTRRYVWRMLLWSHYQFQLGVAHTDTETRPILPRLDFSRYKQMQPKCLNG